MQVWHSGLTSLNSRKSFSTENAYRSHVQSKKHRDRELAHVKDPKPVTAIPAHDMANPSSATVADVEDSDTSEDEQDDMSDNEDTIEGRIAASRRRIDPTDCLFCPSHHSSIDDNVRHMAQIHSFFIPDRDILSDMAGLLSYLGEKVAVGNICLFCPNGGKEFGSLEAVRKHMIDKAHCKLAYESEEDRAELSEYYDFRRGADDAEWEDVEGSDNDDDMLGEDVSSSVLVADASLLTSPLMACPLSYHLAESSAIGL
jgi:pre-60S factor REI1